MLVTARSAELSVLSYQLIGERNRWLRSLFQSKLFSDRTRQSVFYLCVPWDRHRPAVYRICISIAPAMFDRYPRGFTGHVAHPSRSIVC